LIIDITSKASSKVEIHDHVVLSRPITVSTASNGVRYDTGGIFGRSGNAKGTSGNDDSDDDENNKKFCECARCFIYLSKETNLYAS
jgi:hypothetical protein